MTRRDNHILILIDAQFSSSLSRYTRAFHEAYRRTAPADVVANQPWENLPEELREANRNTLVHVLAKLASAGVDLRAWLERRRSDDPPVAYPELPNLAAAPALLSELAILEHERWMASRRLDGWRYGTARDTMRRLHPDLVPYENLSVQSQDVDKAMVMQLADQLGSVSDHENGVV